MQTGPGDLRGGSRQESVAGGGQARPLLAGAPDKMGKSIRSKAHKHKRSKRRERAEEHFDKLADQRAEIAKKHLEQVSPLQPP